MAEGTSCAAEESRFMNTPIVFIVFNRPEPTRRVLMRIREVRPSRLFVVCDGPRARVPTDADRVAEVRGIIERGVDWPCEEAMILEDD